MIPLREKRSVSMTADEFLSWPGDDTPGKVELVEGEVVAMSPASVTHGLIQARLATLLGRRVEEAGLGCVVATEPPVVPRVRADMNVRVPDLGVTCRPVDATALAIDEPVLLIEILSPGNAGSTRANVWAYTTIPSVREILLVQSTRIEAELLRRGADGTWPDRADLLGPDATLRLESVDLTVPVRAVYATTAFG